MGDPIVETAAESNVEEVKDEVELSTPVDVTETITDDDALKETSTSIEAEGDASTRDAPPVGNEGGKDNAEDTIVEDVTGKEDTKTDDTVAAEKVGEENTEGTKDSNEQEKTGDNNNADETTAKGDVKIDTDATTAGDGAVETKTEPSATGDEGVKDTTDDVTAGETKEKSEKKSSESKEKRKYKQRAPLLKWKNVVREMKLIMFDEAVVLYHQLNRKRDKLSKKLSRKRMADMILNTLGNPPFMSRKHVYAVVSKHAKLQAEAGLDVTDISTLKALPQIQSAVTALSVIKNQAKQERLAQIAKEEEEEEEEEEEDDDDEEEDEPKTKKVYKKQSKKRKLDERLDGNEDDSDLDKKLKKMRKKIKKDKNLSKKEKKRVEKEKRQKILDAAVEMYLDAKSKLPPDTTAVTGSIITDVIAELGAPDWLTRHHIYHAIIKHQEDNPPPSSLGLVRAAASIATTSVGVSSDAVAKIKKRADGTPISDAALGRKKEKLTSAQKKAKLDEAIENATAEYYEARQKAKPNRLREGVLSKIISNSVHQVGLPPKFCALISFQTIRNRVTKLEQLNNPEGKSPVYKKSVTIADVTKTTTGSTLPSALVTSKTTATAASGPSPAKSVKFHASSAPPAPIPTSTLTPDNMNNPERDFL